MQILPRGLKKKYDVVVVGGGMSGICAAIASARGGAYTALIQGRSMLGGNASSEIRMHICGANCQMVKQDVNEAGILLELLLENKRLNPRYNFNIWDTVLIDAVQKTNGLDTYLNTFMHNVVCVDNEIKEIHCYQNTTEQTISFSGDIFIDCTGHGTLGFFAGAEYRMGTEGKSEFGETNAPDHPNDNLMGNTLLFKAIDCGKPITYIKPDWANTYTEADLNNRIHYSFNGFLNKDSLQEEGGDSKGLPELYCVDYGYWWIELGGDSGDIIANSENIRDDLMKCLWGVWDHIKNGGEHGAQNYDLQWCGIVPGTRDSRRLVGDAILCESDILSNRIFEDAVAYGGWPMDVHTPGGIKDINEIPSFVINFDGIYTIPYRSYYSKNISNLMMAGRNISATKLGMSSTRVMGTCAIGGQATGTAAALCINHNCTPRELGQNHIVELQQKLLRDDCYIPSLKNIDKSDLARRAKINATSEKTGFEAINIISGVTRRVDDESNCWHSDGISAQGESLTLALDSLHAINEVRIVFDTNLTRDMIISLSSKKQAQQLTTLPPELVKEYELRLLCDNKIVAGVKIQNNKSRLAVHEFDGIKADKIELVCRSTYGVEDAAVYEVRIY